uniref:SCP2 domain-containing protein n=1 Tax=Cyclophora tenuis TaxID=216820 RepID=A0A7S1CYV6_CYCTE|mmetsp:Transcript_13934/g.23671  ORF Transcript_13934/g.23671 Transcript_13934/m.23671 type:complete len:115 (+) Transcript_13934:86-430(+)
MSTFTIQQVFLAMEEAMPSIKGKFPPKVILMTVDGQSFCIDGREGSVSEGEGSVKGDLTVTTTLETLSKLLTKKLTPQQAFMKGLLKIKGNMGLAMKLTILINATRTKLPTPKL